MVALSRVWNGRFSRVVNGRFGVIVMRCCIRWLSMSKWTYEYMHQSVCVYLVSNEKKNNLLFDAFCFPLIRKRQQGFCGLCGQQVLFTQKIVQKEWCVPVIIHPSRYRLITALQLNELVCANRPICDNDVDNNGPQWPKPNDMRRDFGDSLENSKSHIVQSVK